MVVDREQPVVGVHQLTLAHSGARLFHRHLGGAGGEQQLAEPHCDGTGGDEDDLVPGVLQVAQDLDEGFGQPDVQSPGGVCEVDVPILTTIRIDLTLSHLFCLVVGREDGVRHRAAEPALFQHPDA